MPIRLFMITLGLLLAAFTLIGCGGPIVVDGPGSSANRDTDVTNSLGEAYLSYADRDETVTVRDSASDEPLSSIQVFGMTDGDNSLYVAADPHGEYHPAITSGDSSSYYQSRIYLTPTDQRLGTNATSYYTVNGGLLYGLGKYYSDYPRTATVSTLRDQLASLAYGSSAGLVVCVDQPINSYTGRVSATEVAQRATNLSDAFQAIGWQYIFTSRGYSTNQNLALWVVDPYELGIAGGASGALADTLVVIVAPTSGSTGNVLPGSLRVEMTWDASVDLDLHLVRNYADLYDSYNDCYWKYLEQNWGDTYRTTDNPRLQFDNQSGYGPEAIVLDEMDDQEHYTVAVDYWGDANGEPINRSTTATVKVWTKGNSTPRTFLVSNLYHGEPERGDYKIVCDINGATGEVTIADRSITRQATRSPGRKK